MYHRELAKSKTAAKTITYEGDKLKKIVLDTIKKASDLVGSTLGPNGKVVLIERQENLPPFVSKDGISVFQSMAFSDPTAQAILEIARDSSSKTNSEAGDGPQPLWSKVLTPKGFVEMRDLKVGMKICGTEGSIQEVVGIYPKGMKEIYEVEIENRGTVECCVDHLWTVTDRSGMTATVPLKKMLSDFSSDNADGTKTYKYYTPNTHVEFYQNDLEMPLDPYLVGVLLGADSLRDSGSMEISLDLTKKHIIEKLKLTEGLSLTTSLAENKNYYQVKIVGEMALGKSIRDVVTSIGLCNTPNDTKFIPKSYLFSSKLTRESLLQGLIDTDGYTNERGLFEFSTVSKELAEDVKTLANSLGKSVHVSLKEDGNTSIYRITELKGYEYGNKIKKIAPTGKLTEMQCIKVSNEDHLYITDGFVITHNTTTATILAESLIRNGFEYLSKNPHLSPQKVMRELEHTFKNVIQPFVESSSLKITGNISSDLLRKVSLISTNSDAEMTDAVLKCFDLVGHNGNITIAEAPGASGFDIEKIEGFPIARGFEDTCGRFTEEFINDKPNYRVELKSPHFILYNGKLNDMGPLWSIIGLLGQAMEEAIQNKQNFSPNVVLVAHHFSDQVLSALAANFKDPSTLNIMPLKTYMTQQTNSPYHFLVDLASFTGATLFDPLTKPLEMATLADVGLESMSSFECYRYKSVVFGQPDELLIITRSEELEKQAEHAESILDAELLRERLAVLTGGIARLKVLGSSEAELKEKRHRVEDAVASIKGALRYGTLPGGAKTLITLSHKIENDKTIPEAVRDIMGKSFKSPFIRLLTNGGYNKEEILDIYNKMMYRPVNLTEDEKNVLDNMGVSVKPRSALNPFFYTYDALNFKYGDAVEIGVIDSASAVLMAIKNSLSVAKMLMTLSGTVVFKRDHELEIGEAKENESEQVAMQEAIERSKKEEWEPPF